jgi:hypothetical protein
VHCAQVVEATRALFHTEGIFVIICSRDIGGGIVCRPIGENVRHWSGLLQQLKNTELRQDNSGLGKHCVDAHKDYIYSRRNQEFRKGNVSITEYNRQSVILVFLSPGCLYIQRNTD